MGGLKPAVSPTKTDTGCMRGMLNVIHEGACGQKAKGGKSGKMCQALHLLGQNPTLRFFSELRDIHLEWHMSSAASLHLSVWRPKHERQWTVPTLCAEIYSK